MDPSSNKNAADDGQAQSQQLQQQRRRQSSNLFKLQEERPYRRRIKPPPAKVHHVHPARFRRYVQSRTCFSLPQPNNDATSSTTITSAVTELGLQPAPPDDAAIGGSDAATCRAGHLDDGVTWKSMQDAYMEWCSSNDMPLSPGTMAELSFTLHPSKDQG